MTLRTASVRRQWLTWALLTSGGIAAYVVLVRNFGLGNPLRFFDPHQMRVFLPLFVVLRWLAHACRWDGVTRAEAQEPLAVARDTQLAAPVGLAERCACEVNEQKGARVEEVSRLSDVQADEMRHRIPPSPPMPSTDAAALWERARAIVHNVIPDSCADAEYLNLVYLSAELGHVPALAKLGDYAFRRGTFVEAYFWTKLAKRRLELSGEQNQKGMQELDKMLHSIRRAWSAAGQPPEYGNVYDNFPEERSELGRSLLRLDSGYEAHRMKQYVRHLARKGNPDAALFASGVRPTLI